mgnify:FL=1
MKKDLGHNETEVFLCHFIKSSVNTLADANIRIKNFIVDFEKRNLRCNMRQNSSESLSERLLG